MFILMHNHGQGTTRQELPADEIPEAIHGLLENMNPGESFIVINDGEEA